ncbi:MAG: glycosyl transferase family 8 [Nanoarchaeota archaeon]|nr:glycosyl transferase family 8 [Nanoarchaeota archaeon]
MKKHAIITSSDEKFGDFLIMHWLKSLQDNVNLKNIDTVVLDYGLSKDQRNKLKKKGVIVKECKINGSITTLRFRDMADFLRSNKYDQILSIDGGDIIFQADISDKFEEKKTRFRAVLDDVIVTKYTLNNGLPKKIIQYLKNKKMINAGVIFGSSSNFIRVCHELETLILNKNVWGPDQIGLSYLLHEEGFWPIGLEYNFRVCTTGKKYFISNSKFYFKDRKNIELIPIVHNAGRRNAYRPFRNFGYGNGHNQINLFGFILNKLGPKLNFIFEIIYGEKISD